jgi:hypothetical protein
MLFQKKEKGCGGTNWPRPRNGPGAASPTRLKRYTAAAFRTLIGGAHLSDVFLDETGPNTECATAIRSEAPLPSDPRHRPNPSPSPKPAPSINTPPPPLSSRPKTAARSRPRYRNRVHEARSTGDHAQDSLVSNYVLNLFKLLQACKNYRKRTTTRFSMNFMSMESLAGV